MLNASISGIGKFHQTPIFPISIFKYKRDINDRPGTPNYDLYKLSLKSLSKRIYPNIVNCDWTSNVPDEHPIRMIGAKTISGDNNITMVIGNKLYIIPISKAYQIITNCNTFRKGEFTVKDLRSLDILIADDDSKYSNHVRKINHVDKKECLEMPWAKINFIAKKNNSYAITTDSFTHNYTTKSGIQKQYCSDRFKDYIYYDHDTEMATMGCVDGQEVITYKLNGVLYVEAFERAWKRVCQTYGMPTPHGPNSEYIDALGMMIFDSTSNGFVKVKRMIRNKDMGRWTRVDTAGSSILATTDHPFVTKRGRVHVNDLNDTDVLFKALPQYVETSNNMDYDAGHAWLLGMLLCRSKRCDDDGIICTFSMDEVELARKAQKLLGKYFIAIKTKEQHGEKGDYIEVHVKSAVGSIFESIFEGVDKNDRHIPRRVFSEYNTLCRAAFLSGMIDATCYADSKDDSNSDKQIYMGSTNHELAIQQMLLARSLGIDATIRGNYYNGQQDPDAVRWVVSIRMNDLLSDLTCGKKTFSIAALAREDLEMPVKNIEFLGKRDRYEYDVETVSDRFDVSGVMSHNCRTMIGYDRHGMGYKKTGRGNISPATMVLPKLGIEYGICLGKRKKADVDGFFKAFRRLLEVTEKSLVDRYRYICSQNIKAGWFMYENDNIADGKKAIKTGHVEDAMKHGTLALGYIGIANTCYAMFGKYQNQSKEAFKFADRIIHMIKDFADEASERNNLNFSTYSTPAENSCYTICKDLQKQYGKIKGVTDREYLTNSLHIPVFEKVSIKEKLDTETKLAKYSTGGEINYVELESSVVHNLEALNTVIKYGMNANIPYLAINFPIDTCQDCGNSVSEMDDTCPFCGSHKIFSLRRVTGYLTTDYHKFNKGKQVEVKDRVKHSKYTSFKDMKN